MSENPNLRSAKKTSLSGAIIATVIFFIGGILLGKNWDTYSPYLGFPSSETSTPKTLDWSSLNEVYSKVATTYDGEYDPKTLIEGAKKGLVDSLDDPYSFYMDAEESADFTASLHGEVGGGIGIEFAIRGGYPTILRTLPDNPARESGILAGDIIYKVDGEEVWELDSDSIASKTRGAVGTEVTLTVVRNGEEKSFTMTREEINNVSAYYTIEGHTAIITITRFDIDTGRLVSDFAKTITEKGVKKIILDLRNNGGGYVSAAKEILSLWIDGDIVLIQKSKTSPDEITYASRGKAVFSDIRTIVLVNASTASASEITAGALKDYGLATIVGEKTFGKGVVQELITLSDGNLLKLTAASWYTPLGSTINHEGITPDIEVINTYDDTNNLRDPQLDKAKAL